MKRIVTLVMTLVLLLTATACNSEYHYKGSKEELHILLVDIGKVPLSTPGADHTGIYYAVNLLSWCEASSMTEAEIKAAVGAYYAALPNDDIRTQYYEQLQFVVNYCAQLGTAERERLLELAELSAPTWKDEAFAVAASIGKMIEQPPVYVGERTLIGEVLDVKTSFLVMKVTEGEESLTAAEQTLVSGAEYPDGIQAGDTIVVTYTGKAIGGEPAQVNTATLIKSTSLSSLAVPVDSATFKAMVLEVYDASILVEPLEGEAERNCCDKISVSGNLPADIAVADVVSIVYGGEIAESYPAQIHSATVSVVK